MHCISGLQGINFDKLPNQEGVQQQIKRRKSQHQALTQDVSVQLDLHFLDLRHSLQQPSKLHHKQQTPAQDPVADLKCQAAHSSPTIQKAVHQQLMCVSHSPFLSPSTAVFMVLSLGI